MCECEGDADFCSGVCMTLSMRGRRVKTQCAVHVNRFAAAQVTTFRELLPGGGGDGGGVGPQPRTAAGPELRPAGGPEQQHHRK